MSKAARERAKKATAELYKRDERYYVQSIVFLVEDYLFKAPRPYFEQSEVFRDTFQLPPVDGVFDGADDQAPLRLDGIKADDFRAFLSVLMPLPSPEETNVTKEEWLGALSLADMWNFEKIRQIAIDKLGKEHMDAVERIILGRKYNIDEWLLAGHLHLARRVNFLSNVEAEQLGGVPFLIKMVKARDEVRSSFVGGRSGRGIGIIAKFFGINLYAACSGTINDIVIIDDPSKADPEDKDSKVHAAGTAKKRRKESDFSDSD